MNHKPGGCTSAGTHGCKVGKPSGVAKVRASASHSHVLAAFCYQDGTAVVACLKCGCWTSMLTRKLGGPYPGVSNRGGRDSVSCLKRGLHPDIKSAVLQSHLCAVSALASSFASEQVLERARSSAVSSRPAAPQRRSAQVFEDLAATGSAAAPSTSFRSLRERVRAKESGS